MVAHPKSKDGEAFTGHDYTKGVAAFYGKRSSQQRGMIEQVIQ